MIPLFKVRMSFGAINKAVEVMESGYIGQGKVVDEFEKKLSEYFGHPYAVTTNSATSAEHLALHMLKKKFGDMEVLCTPLTCTATNWPVISNGYKIKWVDVDPDTLNMDLNDLERKLTTNVGIVYIVHWGGYPMDYEKLYGILDRHYKKHYIMPEVIEDCAHAMGTTFKGQGLGGHFGGFATYSFQAIKHVTSIDGGVLLCPDEDTYKRAKLLRWYGIDRESNKKAFRCEADIDEVGFKFHMNDVSAAVGIENLRTFEPSLQKNKKCAEYYDKNITTQLVKKISYDPNCSYWLYTMFVKNQDRFMEKMKEKGIMVSRVHERNDIHSCVKQFKCELPNLDKVVKEMICIPCHYGVSDKELGYIVDAINEGW